MAHGPDKTQCGLVTFQLSRPPLVGQAHHATTRTGWAEALVCLCFGVQPYLRASKESKGPPERTAVPNKGLGSKVFRIANRAAANREAPKIADSRQIAKHLINSESPIDI